MTQEVKEEVEELLRSGDRDGAIRLLQAKFNISASDATMLVLTLEKEVGIHSADRTAPIASNTPSTLNDPPENTFNPAGCVKGVAKGLAIFLMIVSLLFLTGAVAVYFYNLQSINNSDRVQGVVTEMNLMDDMGASAPVVEYEWQGRKRSYESTFYSDPPDYYAGQKLFIFVDRDDPAKVTLDTFADRWALIVGLSVPGAIFLLISIVILQFSKRKF